MRSLAPTQIVLATDFSDAAAEALRTAALIADAFCADLSIVYAFLPPSAHASFFAVYGAVDDLTVRLARYRAVDHEVIVALYAHDSGDEFLLRESRTSLRHLAEA